IAKLKKQSHAKMMGYDDTWIRTLSLDTVSQLTALGVKIEGLGADMDREVENLETTHQADVKNIETNMASEVENLGKQLDIKIEQLEKQADEQDKAIKGAENPLAI
ncbi:MAG: hypothetical protein OR994_08125, partial [Candidatus Poseidoniales archaeon]|nr:hypothetical protein [Candidatus Poseidoniales archaeon]